MLNKMRSEKFIKMIGEIDEILHEYGFFVDYDILANHILESIKESNPKDKIMVESEKEPIFKVTRLKSLTELERIFK